MGYRTVVILNNDLASTWQKDPELGQKIAKSMNYARGFHEDPRTRFEGGRVVECCHTEQQSLGIIDGLMLNVNASKTECPGETPEAVQLALLKAAAEKLGYKLTKKRNKKEGDLL